MNNKVLQSKGNNDSPKTQKKTVSAPGIMGRVSGMFNSRKQNKENQGDKKEMAQEIDKRTVEEHLEKTKS